MQKVVKILGSQVVIGDTETNEAMYISITDCYEGILEGDVVEVFKGEDIVIVTLKDGFKEKRSLPKFSSVNPKEEETDQKIVELSKEADNIVKQSSSDSQVKQQAAHIEPVKSVDKVQFESKNVLSGVHKENNLPRRKVRPVGVVVTIVLAVALAYGTHIYIGPNLNADQRNAYNLISGSLHYNFESKGVRMPSIHQFEFYTVPYLMRNSLDGVDIIAFAKVEFGNVPMTVFCKVVLAKEIVDCDIERG